MTHLTKSPVSRDVGESTKTPPDSDCREISDLEKLTIDEAAGENDNEIPKRVQRLVSCQNSGDQDVGEIPPPENNSGIPSTYEMSQTEKLSRSKYQTKLTVTLKTPPAAKPETTKQAGPMTPARALFQHPIRYGIKPEFSTRFQTFPNSAYLPPTPRIPPMDGRSFLVNHYAGIRNHPNGLSGSLPRLPGLVPKPEIGLNASHIPLEDMQKEIGESKNGCDFQAHSTSALLLLPVDFFSNLKFILNFPHFFFFF